MLADVGGRLTVARRAGEVLGFAISEGLVRDEAWQQMLASTRLPSGDDEPLAAVETVIVQELAVDDRFRGRGIARGLVKLLLADRIERHAVLSVYDDAAPVRAMYQRWGFVDVGTASAPESGDLMHLMHQRLPWNG